MSGSRIELSWKAGVTHLQLRRPERRNAIDLDLARALLAASLHERTAASRCVLLTGAGAHFCVGGDLKSFHGRDDLPDHLTAVTSYFHAAINRLVGMPAPLVVAVRGNVAGAGLGLACAADVLLAEEGSTFRAAYGALGLTPDASVSHFLPQLVGLRRAQRMTLLGEVLDADEAQRSGLTSETVPAGQLLERATAVAEHLAAGPTRAYGETTRLLRSASRRTLADQLEDESATLRAVAATPAAAEGITAFLERRPPVWPGS